MTLYFSSLSVFCIFISDQVLDDWDGVLLTMGALRSFVSRGAWVAQSIERLTLGFGSGHDLIVHGSGPVPGFVLEVQGLLGILSLPFSLPRPPARSLSLSLSK